MTAPFRLYGAELSPYSVKVRSYLRCKGLAFEWLERTNARQEEFSRYATLPLAPILVDADEHAMQDSTPMIEALERQYPEPSIWPDEPALQFIAALIEDYADEWLNKAMFHYRWAYPENQESAAKRLTDMLFEGAAPEGVEEMVRARMVGRLHHVGSSPETAPVIEGSFTRLLGLIENLLASRDYLFGDRPCLADFGLAGQLMQLLSDPTPGALMRAQAPRTVTWLERMQNPSPTGSFASLASLRGDLVDLLRSEIASAYLVWMSANAQAVSADANGVSVEIAGQLYTQKPQRYAAKAYAELKRKRALVDDADLAALLEETGCDVFLASGTQDEAEPEERQEDGDDEAEDEQT